VLDIRFWREGEQTVFDVIKGDPKMVERRDIAAEGMELRTCVYRKPKPDHSGDGPAKDRV
jgi:hypothetical protein